MIDRKRPLCRDEACTVEILPAERYCRAHQWIIDRWLERSRRRLAAYIAKAEGGTGANKDRGFGL